MAWRMAAAGMKSPYFFHGGTRSPALIEVLAHKVSVPRLFISNGRMSFPWLSPSTDVAYPRTGS
jgi:hypothetical protein